MSRPRNVEVCEWCGEPVVTPKGEPIPPHRTGLGNECSGGAS